MRCLYVGWIILFLFSCRSETKPGLFELKENSGITFRNDLTESKDFNVFLYRNFYNGGGVAIGDINNDGLSDVFFTGNQVANRLYLNKGDLQFEDISGEAGFGEKKQWSTGVVFVDINSDGWLDIYVCNAGHMLDSHMRRNQLFINNHDLTFTDKATEYGLDDAGYTTHASFFDYDMDGDLDCFLVNNSPIPVNTLNYSNMRNIPVAESGVADFLRGGGDHLYRNDGGTFKEVTYESGIHGSLISLGLGVTIGDVNGDAWPDIYVSNDFFERDYLYINQRNGHFSDEIESWIGHTSLASMGADLQDINNDSYPDLFTTDMLPEDDYRLKTTSSFENYDIYDLRVHSGFHQQFMQNAVQLNNRNGRFLEIAHYSGVPGTDWSWGAVMFDADNDGFSDLYVCNGIVHDLTNQDFIDFFANDLVKKKATSGKKDEVDEVIKKMPSTPIPNKAYRNTGSLHFEETGKAWGLTQPSFSNGAAYGDLDNDGDLDLVVNNVNAQAFVYANRSREQNKNHFIGFSFKGKDPNRFSVGAKVQVYANGQVFTREQIPARGFQSSIDYVMQIGLGQVNRLDSVRVIWPDRMVSTYTSLAIDQVHRLEQLSTARPFDSLVVREEPVFITLQQTLPKQEEDDYVDFYAERNMPLMLSREGPGTAVGDVNGDGLEDLFIGGTFQKQGQLFFQKTDGGFAPMTIPELGKEPLRDQPVALFFDADSDKDLDLFIASGGNSKTPRQKELENSLYLNDGRGHFKKSLEAFPPSSSNTGAVAAGDMDGDGDLDLFVGGRSISYLYGSTPESYLFVNDGKGQFTELSKNKAKGLKKAGMVTAAHWADLTGDNKPELVVAGDWMPVRIFSFQGDSLALLNTNLSTVKGWWRSLSICDLDGDGMNDLVLGNIGENFYLRPDSARPVRLWINSFGMDGTIRQVMTRQVNGKDVPVFMKKNLEEQFPYLKKQNLQHETFANRSVQELFGEDMMKGALAGEFNFCSTIIAWNEGNGQFSLDRLAPYVQFSSVNAIACTDVNNDGRIDLVMGGNQFGFQPQLGRLDGSLGHVLINQGKRTFNLLSTRESGIQIEGMVKQIRSWGNGENYRLLFMRNNDTPVLFRRNNVIKK